MYSSRIHALGQPVRPCPKGPDKGFNCLAIVGLQVRRPGRDLVAGSRGPD